MRRIRLRVFVLALALIRWALRDPVLDREVGRMLRYYMTVGNLDGFQADLS